MGSGEIGGSGSACSASAAGDSGAEGGSGAGRSGAVGCDVLMGTGGGISASLTGLPACACLSKSCSVLRPRANLEMRTERNKFWH